MLSWCCWTKYDFHQTFDATSFNISLVLMCEEQSCTRLNAHFNITDLKQSTFLCQGRQPEDLMNRCFRYLGHSIDCVMGATMMTNLKISGEIIPRVISESAMNLTEKCWHSSIRPSSSKRRNAVSDVCIEYKWRFICSTAPLGFEIIHFLC